jgi:hypothetical protein
MPLLMARNLEIGGKLRALYDDDTQPVPERITQLVTVLDGSLHWTSGMKADDAPSPPWCWRNCLSGAQVCPRPVLVARVLEQYSIPNAWF